MVVVDALSFGAEPGTIDVVEPDRIEGQGPSTHGPAPVAFLEILTAMHPCRCVVVGIEPERLDLAAPLSGRVAGAVGRLVEAFRSVARRLDLRTDG